MPYYDFNIDDLVVADPRQIKLFLQQHIGAPAVPVVKEGDSIELGQLVAACPAGELGANLHAGIAGRVKAVDETAIVIEKQEGERP